MIEILTADQAEASELDLPDIYYTARYGRSAELIDDGSWECAVGEGCVYPYVRREVPDTGGEYDIVSPYGYSGVVAPSSGARQRFLRSFRDHGRGIGLIAEFMRTHPLDVPSPESVGLIVDSWRSHPTFAVDTSAQGSDYWSASSGRHRTAVRKAQRHGVEIVEVEPQSVCAPESTFQKIYDQTMARVGSSHRLRLSQEYYQRLQLTGRVRVLEARLGGRAVATAMFLTWGQRLHYHLSGSCDDGMRIGATNLILHHAVADLLPPCGILHLGGGLRPDDGLHRFKASIANRATETFLCQTIVNQGRYRELVDRVGGAETSDYFPAYRRSS